jgi:maltose O-acetyltransferase
MIILPGVSVGDRCVIGAGSIVVDNVPSASAVVGNAARIVRPLEGRMDRWM